MQQCFYNPRFSNDSWIKSLQVKTLDLILYWIFENKFDPGIKFPIPILFFILYHSYRIYGCIFWLLTHSIPQSLTFKPLHNIWSNYGSCAGFTQSWFWGSDRFPLFAHNFWFLTNFTEVELVIIIRICRLFSDQCYTKRKLTCRSVTPIA